MYPQLKNLLHQAEDRYLEQQEIQHFQYHTASLAQRLEIYELVREQEVAIFQPVANQLLEVFSQQDGKVLEQAVKNWLSVMRYCAMAMLLNNREFLQQRSLEWMTDIAQARQTQDIDRKISEWLQIELHQVLSSKQMTLLQPFFQQASDAILGMENSMPAELEMVSLEEQKAIELQVEAISAVASFSEMDDLTVPEFDEESMAQIVNFKPQVESVEEPVMVQMEEPMAEIPAFEPEVESVEEPAMLQIEAPMAEIPAFEPQVESIEEPAMLQIEEPMAEIPAFEPEVESPEEVTLVQIEEPMASVESEDEFIEEPAFSQAEVDSLVDIAGFNDGEEGLSFEELTLGKSEAEVLAAIAQFGQLSEPAWDESKSDSLAAIAAVDDLEDLNSLEEPVWGEVETDSSAAFAGLEDLKSLEDQTLVQSEWETIPQVDSSDDLEEFKPLEAPQFSQLD
jgi:hypothetical protein